MRLPNHSHHIIPGPFCFPRKGDFKVSQIAGSHWCWLKQAFAFLIWYKQTSKVSRTNGSPSRMHRVVQPTSLHQSLHVRDLVRDGSGGRADGNEAEVSNAVGRRLQFRRCGFGEVVFIFDIFLFGLTGIGGVSFFCHGYKILLFGVTACMIEILQERSWFS